MAINLQSSREIFWNALKDACQLSISEPGDLLKFFQETSYGILFSGVPSEMLEIYDRSVAKMIIDKYHESNAEVDLSIKKIKNKSRKLRGDEDAKIITFFMWIHEEVYDFS
ncbi:hypothetical protein ACFL4T_02970 [candidate division KSB1 bacterium]